MKEPHGFETLKSMVALRDLRVLEVGGAVAPRLVSECGVERWVALDINPAIFPADPPPWYHRVVASASGIPFPENQFDVVYSLNCLEHVNDVRASIRQIYRVLKPRGLFYTLFGPIWSGPDGHHTWVEDEGRLLTFTQGVFEDWAHLAYSRDELYIRLLARHRHEAAKAIVDYVYCSRDINRSTDRMFEQATAAVPFVRVAWRAMKRSRRGPDGEIRERAKANYPGVADFRTSAYLWVLAKGRVRFLQQMRVRLLGGFAVFRAMWKEKFSGSA